MKEGSKPTPLLICTACGIEQSAATHLCSKCGAPLTPFAHTDPVLGIQARGFALQKATTEPKKLIVVIGMWLWLGPMLLMGLGMLFGGGIGFREAIRSGSTSELLLALFIGLIGTGLTLVATIILFRTTASYANGDLQPKDKSAKEGEVAEEPDVDAESLECLSCGQVLAHDANFCPACGWSFKAD
jgi:hypothetical protein